MINRGNKVNGYTEILDNCSDCFESILDVYNNE